MKTLTIFHDPNCTLCARFRRWLGTQPKIVITEFLAFDSDAAAARFPGLADLHPEKDIVVLADDGRWWQGPAAWLTCLWTTRDYRDWSYRLASPALQPLVRKMVHLLSENRLTISRLLRPCGERQLIAEIQAIPPVVCESHNCPLP